MDEKQDMAAVRKIGEESLLLAVRAIREKLMAEGRMSVPNANSMLVRVLKGYVGAALFGVCKTQYGCSNEELDGFLEQVDKDFDKFVLEVLVAVKRIADERVKVVSEDIAEEEKDRSWENN